MLSTAAAAACLLAILVAVIAPGAADSAPLRVVVFGQTASTPPPACPGKIVNEVEIIPCRVEGHVSGFQALAGGVARPYEAPFEGKVVAWSITLSRPSTKVTSTTTDEVGFFNEFLGQPSEARIGILRPVEGSNPPQYKLVRQSPVEVLNSYFGSTVIFALEHPLSVLQGPDRRAHRPHLGADVRLQRRRQRHLARQSAAKTLHLQSRHQDGHPQQVVGKMKTYGCYYSNARLLYTATLVKKP